MFKMFSCRPGRLSVAFRAHVPQRTGVHLHTTRAPTTTRGGRLKDERRRLRRSKMEGKKKRHVQTVSRHCSTSQSGLHCQDPWAEGEVDLPLSRVPSPRYGSVGPRLHASEYCGAVAHGTKPYPLTACVSGVVLPSTSYCLQAVLMTFGG